MLSKSKRKRLQAKKRLETLPRVSRPPEVLEMILTAVTRLLVEHPDVDLENLPKFSESLENVKRGKVTLADVLDANPALAGLGTDLDDYLRAALLLQWAKQLRTIARGKRRGFIEVAYAIDDKGEFDLKRDPLLQALNACGKDHDLRHLRECAVETCKAIFWAMKLPSAQLVDPKAEVGCSPRCKNILRVRNHRSKSDNEQSERQVRLPSADVIASIHRALKLWPEFSGSKEEISQLAEDQEITPELCKAVVSHLKAEAGQTERATARIGPSPFNPLH